MRISISPNDLGFDNFISIIDNGLAINVYLDGEIVRDVTTVDEESGYLVRYMRDNEGDLVVEDGAPKSETLYGNVKIHLQDESA